MFSKLRNGQMSFVVTVFVLLVFDIMIFQDIFVARPCYAYKPRSRGISIESRDKLFEEGLEGFNKGDYKKAIKKFKEAIKKIKKDDPFRKKANFYLGYSFYLLGDYSKSKDYFDAGKPYKRKELVTVHGGVARRDGAAWQVK